MEAVGNEGEYKGWKRRQGRREGEGRGAEEGGERKGLKETGEREWEW